MKQNIKIVDNDVELMKNEPGTERDLMIRHLLQETRNSELTFLF